MKLTLSESKTLSACYIRAAIETLLGGMQEGRDQEIASLETAPGSSQPAPIS
jgi:hypothetical protein